ncbi:hypothetical protein KY290_027605 [Solanum tuberosum]|uniref:Uncharacterized protein n=1 Tax=Solanum tuberosum TaxID=4113 RepID=A0ABQ7UHB5_SOLTU|nr:hypothetical protein KY290_027605 [Solanum tuberosum]
MSILESLPSSSISSKDASFPSTSSTCKSLAKSCNPWMQIRSLVQQKPKGFKEYVVAAKLDQHPILANKQEQFITLQMPEDFP